MLQTLYKRRKKKNSYPLNFKRPWFLVTMNESLPKRAFFFWIAVFFGSVAQFWIIFYLSWNQFNCLFSGKSMKKLMRSASKLITIMFLEEQWGNKFQLWHLFVDKNLKNRLQTLCSYSDECLNLKLSRQLALIGYINNWTWKKRIDKPL